MFIYFISTKSCFSLAEPPKVTRQSKSLENVDPGITISFTVQATGTGPLNYEWQWKPAGESGSEEWQQSPAEWSHDAALIIPSVQKTNEGWYHCIISNCAGTVTSKPVKLSVGKRIFISTPLKVL